MQPYASLTRHVAHLLYGVLTLATTGSCLCSDFKPGIQQCSRYLSQQDLVAMQQTVSLAAEDVALSLVITLLHTDHSCKAAL